VVAFRQAIVTEAGSERSLPAEPTEGSCAGEGSVAESLEVHLADYRKPPKLPNISSQLLQ
jgi:hypothetical protein